MFWCSVMGRRCFFGDQECVCGEDHVISCYGSYAVNTWILVCPWDSLRFTENSLGDHVLATMGHADLSYAGDHGLYHLSPSLSLISSTYFSRISSRSASSSSSCTPARYPAR